MWLSILLRFLPLFGRLKTIVSFLRGRWKLVATLLSFAAVLLTGWYINNLQDRIEEAKKDRRQFAEWLSECQDANASNLATIRALEGAVINLRDAVVVSDEKARQAASEAARREAEAADRLNDTLTELEDLRNAEPSCAAIADLDIGAACPAAVGRLRERAEASNQD